MGRCPSFGVAWCRSSVRDEWEARPRAAGGSRSDLAPGGEPPGADLDAVMAPAVRGERPLVQDAVGVRARQGRPVDRAGEVGRDQATLDRVEGGRLEGGGLVEGPEVVVVVAVGA